LWTRHGTGELHKKLSDPESTQTSTFHEAYGQGTARGTYATLENNECSNNILVNTKSKESDAFFRFTVAARAGVLPSLANVDQWYKRPHRQGFKFGKDGAVALAPILNVGEPIAIQEHHAGCVADLRESMRVEEEGLSH
jgi:hypothetical protein